MAFLSGIHEAWETEASLGPRPTARVVAATVEPRADVVETYWLFSEAWAALTKPGAKLSRAAALLSAVLFKKDAYFDVSDPLPFLGALFVHLPTLLARNVRTGNKWAKIDPCIGKMTEENGD